VEFSEWAAPIVPVINPDGSVRICSDYKVTANRAVLTDTYPFPKVEDLFAALHGGKLFSKLDLSHAYQQIELSEESKFYTTINTQRSLFQYERLPLRSSAAPPIFQWTMDSLFQGFSRVCVYIDDILVTGSNEEEHFSNLQKVMDK
jgi:hypothetical protein